MGGCATREQRQDGPPNGLPPCPLCDTRPHTFAARRDRTWFRCPHCALVFLDPARRPGPEEEIARYRLHRNSSDDPGYTAFLQPLVSAIARFVEPGAKGIDYGCGPVPVLSELLSQAGYPTAYYDPFFFPDAAVLADRYDFVACCEVAEHAFSPRQLFERMGDLMRTPGIMAVMTQLYDDAPDFADWWYTRDITHVSFYSSHTMQWIADEFDWMLHRPAANIAVFATQRG